MEILAFLLTMTEDIGRECLSDGQASRALGFFLTGSAQTAYTNDVYPSASDPNHLPVTWPRIVYYLLNRFITEELLRKEQYAVTSAQIMQIDTEMDFEERLLDIIRHFRDVPNTKLLNCFKQGIPNNTRSLPETNLCGFPLRLSTT